MTPPTPDLGQLGQSGTHFRDQTPSRAYLGVSTGNSVPTIPTVPTAAVLLKLCADQDIRLWVSNGRLRYDAPAGSLGPELRSALSATRAELVALLAGEGQKPESTRESVPTVPTVPTARIRPSSPPPSFGFTRAGHVVELPRTPGEERKDPLKLVTGLGWPEWTPATAGDRQGIEPDGENAA